LYTSHAPTREERLAALPAGVRGFIGPWVETDLILQEFDAQLQAKREGDRNLTEALVDPSSGLYNRRGLVRRVRELGAQAMRMHQGLACLVFELDAESEEATPARAVRWFRGVQSTARLSDVTGRLGPREFAVIAPATDAAGAVRLAERVAAVVRETAEKEGLARDTIRIRAGYEAVANLGYTPVEPVALLLRATSALHSGESEPQIN